MDLASIVLILQLALSLLFSVQSTPNLPEAIRLQAVDFSYQAIEIATDAIAELANPNANELGLASNETSTPCILFPDKICKYPIAPPVRHIPTADEYPVAKFTFNGNELTGIKTNNMDIGDVSINLGRQFVKLNESFTLSWNISQKDNHTLKCDGISTEISGSITKILNNNSFNFNLNCYDNISGTLSGYSFQVLSL
jgi:hypothetical protein